MSTNHHPDEASLLSYAAGSLPESFEILIACHLQQCEHCRTRVAQAEMVGGLMLEAMEPVAVTGREKLLALLDDETEPTDVSMPLVEPDTDPDTRTHSMPDPLYQLMNEGDAGLDWKRLVPGIQQIRLDSVEGNLRLLKIAPGISIPLHSHEGSEMTLIVQGSYSDELGRFQAGDVSDVDPDVEHQPITDGSEPCICLVATDAPLRFSGLLPRILQPFTGF
mgnify:FL=1